MPNAPLAKIELSVTSILMPGSLVGTLGILTPFRPLHVMRLSAIVWLTAPRLTMTPSRKFPRQLMPLTSVPMKLFRTVMPVEPLSTSRPMETPFWPFPEIMLRAAAVAPPMVLLGASLVATPFKMLPIAAVP